MGAPRDVAVRLAVATAAWLSGIAVQLQQPLLWPSVWYAGLLALAAASITLAWWRRTGGGWLGTLSMVVALALAAFASTGWRAQQRLAQVLPAALEGQDLLLTGVVAGLPREGPNGTRFVFEVEHASLLGQRVTVPPRISLGWYGDFDRDVGDTVPPLRAGQRWQLAARLHRPHGSLNPHGFDYELWLFEQGIRASGSVHSRAVGANRLLAEGVVHPIDRLRQRLSEAISRQVADGASAGVLAALAVGDQAAIGRNDWDLFRRTGVAHLVSISGLHVTMFAWLAGGLVGFAWRRSARLMLVVPAPLAARWGGVLAAAGYALLAGWGVPAQRTLWMLATLALMRTLGVRWPAPLALLVAALVVTVFDPWALVQPGFWLSFGAVGLLMSSLDGVTSAHAGRSLERLRAAVGSMLRTQAVASVGLAPLSVLLFQQVSLVGFVANLVAIPLVTLLITPLALLGIIWAPLWSLDSLLVQGLMSLLGALAAWPQAVWTAAVPPLWAAAFGLLGGLVLILPLPWHMRLLGLPMLLPLLLPAPARMPEGQFELLAADVGQGTAVLLRTRHHVLVYDSGPRYSPEADAGQRVLLPLLRSLGVRQVDLLVLSHRDSDHVGGAAALLAQADVRMLSSSLEEGHPLLALAPAHRRCEAGRQWDWDGVHFEMLHPLAEDYGHGAKSNALSCVLRVRSANGSAVLLTGDIESAQEAALVARLGSRLRSKVLLVPHHGSKTSSSVAFLRAVAPEVAVAQAGYRSRFGHPAADIVERYRALGIRFERSDRCGAWMWTSDGSDGGGICQRERDARYWHLPFDSPRAYGSPGG